MKASSAPADGWETRSSLFQPTQTWRENDINWNRWQNSPIPLPVWFTGTLEKRSLKSMTKAELVDHVTSLGDLTRRDGEVIVDTLFDSVIAALKADDKVEVRGFGSFRTRQRKPRTGRNPKTGASVSVPAKRVPYFKPSKELRDLVNPGESAQTSPHIPIDPHHPPAM